MQNGLVTLPTTLISMKVIRRSCDPSLTHHHLYTPVYKLLGPETESQVKSAAVFSKLLRRHNQPNQSSRTAIFVFDSYTELWEGANWLSN